MKKMPYYRKKMVYGFLFITPWLIGFILFFLAPFLQSCSIVETEIFSYVPPKCKRKFDEFTAPAFGVSGCRKEGTARAEVR